MTSEGVLLSAVNLSLLKAPSVPPESSTLTLSGTNQPVSAVHDPLGTDVSASPYSVHCNNQSTYQPNAGISTEQLQRDPPFELSGISYLFALENNSVGVDLLLTPALKAKSPTSTPNSSSDDKPTSGIPVSSASGLLTALDNSSQCLESISIQHDIASIFQISQASSNIHQLTPPSTFVVTQSPGEGGFDHLFNISDIISNTTSTLNERNPKGPGVLSRYEKLYYADAERDIKPNISIIDLTIEQVCERLFKVI